MEQLTVLTEKTKKLYQVINICIIGLAIILPITFVMFRLGQGSENRQMVINLLAFSGLLLATALGAQAWLWMRPQETLSTPLNGPVKLVLNPKSENFEKTQLKDLGFTGNYVILQQPSGEISRELSAREIKKIYSLAQERKWLLEIQPRPSRFLNKAPGQLLRDAAGILSLTS